jgi:AraC-like DNA-binding protein
MPENILRVQMFADKALRMSSYILHPMLMDFQQVHSVKNGNWALHTHFSDFELIIPESGDYFCALDGVEICCVPGEFLLIQPGQSHQDHIQSGHSMHVFHFKLINPEQKSYINQIFSNAVSPAEQVMPLPEAAFTRQVIGLLFTSGKKSLPFPVSEGLFLSLFRLLAGVFPPEVITQSPDGNERNNRLLRQVTQIFDDHMIDGEIPAGIVEKKLGVSSRTWHRISHELFGTAPRNAFERFRLMGIRSFMLKNPAMSVKEVACRFNFPDPFYFSRVFRRHFGYPPSRLSDRKKYQD